MAFDNLGEPKFIRHPEQPVAVDIYITDDIFIKQIVIPAAGTFIPQHSHAYDHTSMLAKGRVRIWKDGILDDDYEAPKGIIIKAGVKHMFLSLEDETIIYCIHNLHGDQLVSILEEHQVSGVE